MSISATKVFQWDCAHLLDGHLGLCKNLHGHTYIMEVTVAQRDGEVIAYGPACGMVIDFKDLKGVVKEVIVDTFDHAFVAFTKTSDPYERELIDLNLKYKKKLVLLEYRPTAENMARAFYKTLQQQLIQEEYTVTRVKLYETPTSYAIYEEE